jgi:hypothetical protein
MASPKDVAIQKTGWITTSLMATRDDERENDTYYE